MKKRWSIGNLIFKNWPSKVLAVVAALLLFLFYHLGSLSTHEVRVPLTVVQNSRFVPGTDYPHEVKIELRGEREKVAGLTEEDFTAKLDLTSIQKEGKYTVAVKIIKKKNALDIDPLQVTPAPTKIAVSMEKRVTKIVPIILDMEGFLDPGMIIGSQSYTPVSIAVSGPAQAVKAVTEVKTEALDLTEMKEGVNQPRVKLIADNPLVSVDFNREVQLSILVERALSSRVINDFSLGAPQFPGNLTLKSPLAPLTIKLESRRADIMDITLPVTMFTLDTAGIKKAGSYRVPIVLANPLPPELDGVRIIDYSPREANITVEPR